MTLVLDPAPDCAVLWRFEPAHFKIDMLRPLRVIGPRLDELLASQGGVDVYADVLQSAARSVVTCAAVFDVACRHLPLNQEPLVFLWIVWPSVLTGVTEASALDCHPRPIGQLAHIYSEIL